MLYYITESYWWCVGANHNEQSQRVLEELREYVIIRPIITVENKHMKFRYYLLWQKGAAKMRERDKVACGSGK